MDFKRAPKNVDQILDVIAMTPVGSRYLDDFLPKHQGQSIVIRSYPQTIVAQLREALGPGQPIGACFMIEEGLGIIYLDLSSPLGVLAPFLMHEIVHSLNPLLWENARVPRPVTREERDQLFLEAETEAFEAQHRFTVELGRVFPEFQRFLQDHYPKAKILNERLLASDIAELYGFKTA